jgi:hypothetical protein
MRLPMRNSPGPKKRMGRRKAPEKCGPTGSVAHFCVWYRFFRLIPFFSLIPILKERKKKEFVSYLGPLRPLYPAVPPRKWAHRGSCQFLSLIPFFFFFPFFVFDPIFKRKKERKKERIRSLWPTWAHSDLCTLQLSPLYHRDEGIEEVSRNMYLCMV